MVKSHKIRNKTLVEQLICMKSKYPQFKTYFTSHSSIRVIGQLMPTSRSALYTFKLDFNLSGRPKIKITSPKLQINSKGESIPHLYLDNSLCLYHPKYYEFRGADLICDTIIPWISLWLYYYEVWHLTDKWLGGGEHPQFN